jgi:dolichyl-phosphate-mannose-protein mannosyltransferase
MPSRWMSPALLTAVTVLAVIVRLVALGVEGHNGDVSIMHGWAERMVEVGPFRFYEGSGSIYPALLYPLWGLGALLDDGALDLAIKGLSIPFDLAIGALLFVLLRSRIGEGRATLAAALYLLNPAAVLAGPVWGQVDAAGTLPFLAALVAVANRKHGLAGVFGALALLVKPQFGLVLLPVLAVAVIRSPRPLWSGAPFRVLGGAVATYVLVALPLLLDPVRYASLFAATAARQPFTSLNAFNPWGLILGFKVPDDAYVVAGSVLLVAGLALSLLPLRRSRELLTILAVGAAVVFAFYVLPTRVHERYLFPAIAVLAPIAVAGRVELAAYAALSLGFAGSLVYALLDTTPFSLPEPIASAVTSPTGVWAIGIVLLGSIVGWLWLLFVRDPRRRGRPLDRGA